MNPNRNDSRIITFQLDGFSGLAFWIFSFFPFVLAKVVFFLLIAVSFDFYLFFYHLFR